MRTREFAQLGFKTSVFGMGCMRLPQAQTRETEKVDEIEAIKMIRYAIDHGVTYIDTAYDYHEGASEVIVGKALQEGYREKTKLATKLPLWHVKSYQDLERLLDEQLARLQVDYVDFYLLHALNAKWWQTVKELKVIRFLEEMLVVGKIKHLGFSFHDELPVFKEIIDAYQWDMCQIQLNILDENIQAGVEGLCYAGAKGIPVVIMEPLKGGKLGQNLPTDVLALWEQASEKRSPAEWAFRWLYNFPEVVVILSGVSTMEQLKDNIRIFAEAEPNVMSEEELNLVRKVKDLYKSKTKVFCTGCEYCLPCPQGVAIPRIFAYYNNVFIYNNRDQSASNYQKLVTKANDVSQCVECGACEQSCPQNIPIIEKLKEAHQEIS